MGEDEENFGHDEQQCQQTPAFLRESREERSEYRDPEHRKDKCLEEMPPAKYPWCQEGLFVNGLRCDLSQ